MNVGVLWCCSSAECQHPNIFVVLTFRRLHLFAQPDAVLELHWLADVVGINTARGSKNSSVLCLQNRMHSATLVRPLMKD